MSDSPSGPPPSDPLALWREWIDLAERRWREASSSSSESSAAVDLPDSVLQAVLGLQASIHRLAELYLSSLQLARRDDLSEIVERLDRLEGRFDALERQLADALAGISPAEPRRPEKKREKKNGRKKGRKR